MSHQYKSLTEAARAVVRIHGPLPSDKVRAWLKRYRSHIPIPPDEQLVATCLHGLKENGEVEFRAGLWYAKPMKGDW